jgi:hypothetical protein
MTERKARLMAESARARRRLAANLAPMLQIEASAEQMFTRAASVLRQPAVAGALALGLALIGPRRVLGVVRWAVLTLPFHPLGRRLIPVIGARVTAWLAGRRRQR